MEKLIRMITNYIIEEKDVIDIDLKESVYDLKINLKTPEKYMGKIIGKNGRIAKAIRLIASASNENKKKIYINILSKNER